PLIKPDLRVILPPLSQTHEHIDSRAVDRWNPKSSSFHRLARRLALTGLLALEAVWSFCNRCRSRQSAQTIHRPRGGTCRERTQPRIAQMRSLSTDISSARAKSGNHHSWRSSCLVPILPWVSSQRDKSFRTDVLV